MTFQLEQPPVSEATREHEATHQPSTTTLVIAKSHIQIAVGDLIVAYKQLGRGEGFDGLATVEQAQEHLRHAVDQLNGVWPV